jgi:oxaloacetate decarboxylase alpha subunit
VKSPVAGSLVRHTCAEGDKVAEGQTILIVESMKMELEVKAPAGGQIHYLLPKGAKIGSQQVMAEIL